MSIAGHIRELVEWAAHQPCNRSNCGTVCLCGPCHARRVQELWEKKRAKEPKQHADSGTDAST